VLGVERVGRRCSFGRGLVRIAGGTKREERNFKGDGRASYIDERGARRLPQDQSHGGAKPGWCGQEHEIKGTCTRAFARKSNCCFPALFENAWELAVAMSGSAWSVRDFIRESPTRREHQPRAFFYMSSESARRQITCGITLFHI
jgi:hypothetical protein